MGRRDTDVETGRESQRFSEVRKAAVVGWAFHHSYVVDKNQEGYLGSKRYQPQVRPHSQGSRARKINSHNLWL